jgi:hypothetical protein
MNRTNQNRIREPRTLSKVQSKVETIVVSENNDPEHNVVSENNDLEPNVDYLTQTIRRSRWASAEVGEYRKTDGSSFTFEEAMNIIKYEIEEMLMRFNDTFWFVRRSDEIVKKCLAYVESISTHKSDIIANLKKRSNGYTFKHIAKCEKSNNIEQLFSYEYETVRPSEDFTFIAEIYVDTRTDMKSRGKYFANKKRPNHFFSHVTYNNTYEQYHRDCDICAQSREEKAKFKKISQKEINGILCDSHSI